MTLSEVQGPSRASGMGRGILPKVWDGSLDLTRSPGWVGRTSGKSGTGREVLQVVRDWSLDPSKGLGRVGKSFGRSEID